MEVKSTLRFRHHPYQFFLLSQIGSQLLFLSGDGECHETAEKGVVYPL